MLFVAGFALVVAVTGKTKMRRGEKITRDFSKLPKLVILTFLYY